MPVTISVRVHGSPNKAPQLPLLSGDVFVFPTPLEATIFAHTKSRQTRRPYKLLLPDNEEGVHSGFVSTTTSQLLLNLLGFSTALNLNKGQINLHILQTETDPLIIQIIPLIDRYIQRINKELNLLLYGMTLKNLVIGTYLSGDKATCHQISHSKTSSAIVTSHPVLDQAQHARNDSHRQLRERKPNDQAELPYLESYMHEQRLRLRQEDGVQRSTGRVQKPASEFKEVDPFISLATNLTNCWWHSGKEGYWDEADVQMRRVEELRHARVHFLRSKEAISDNHLDTVVESTIRLLESTQYKGAAEWLIVVQNGAEAFTVKSRLLAYAAEIREDLPVYVTSESSSQLSQEKLFTSQRRKGRRTVTITSHGLLDMAPYHMPMDIDVIVDGGFIQRQIPFPWNPSVHHSVSVRLSTEDIARRISALGRSCMNRSDYFICCHENDVTDAGRINFGQSDPTYFLPALLIGLIYDKAIFKTSWTYVPYLPCLEYSLRMLRRLQCIDEHLHSNVNEQLCGRYLQWLCFIGDAQLASILFLAEHPKYDCIVEAASICGMLMKCPHPFVARRSDPDRQRLCKLNFAVQEGDLMTLGNIMFEVVNHDRAWSQARGVDYEGVMAAVAYANKIHAYSAKPNQQATAASSRTSRLGDCLAVALLDNLLVLDGNNSYRLVDRRPYPDMADLGKFGRCDELLFHVSSTSTLHLLAELPKAVVFWKGSADGRVLGREVGSFRRNIATYKNPLRWPIFVDHCSVVNLR